MTVPKKHIDEMNRFEAQFDDEALGAMSSLALAYVGDAVYELLIRTELCRRGRLTSRELHRETVRYVSAPAQARAAMKLLPMLTDSERAVFRRARNTKVNSVPRNAGLGDYHAATALEALFGWLYLKGERQRLDALFSSLMEE
jgi:ribonuclease-3 family protein